MEGVADRTRIEQWLLEVNTLDQRPGAIDGKYPGGDDKESDGETYARQRGARHEMINVN